MSKNKTNENSTPFDRNLKIRVFIFCDSCSMKEDCDQRYGIGYNNYKGYYQTIEENKNGN